MSMQKRDLFECILLTALFLVSVALSGQVSYPTNATLWIAYGPDGTVHTGITQSNQVTTSGQPDFFISTNTTDIAEKGGEIGYTNWPALPTVGEWADKGVYTHSNQVVMVYQPHTRQADWKVDSTPALYGIYHGAGTEAAEWVQPAGGHDAYQIGDRVLFNGNTYESLINANVWSPAVYPAGWELQ